MPFITQDKTNWKFLLIVVVLAAIVGGGIFWFTKQQIPQLSEIKIPPKIQEEKISFEQLSICNTGTDCILVNHKSCGGMIKTPINKKYESLYNSTPEFQESTGKMCETRGLLYDEQKQIIENLIPTRGGCGHEWNDVTGKTEEKGKCSLSYPKYFTDWLDYWNEEYEFKVDYLSNWFVRESTSTKEVYFGERKNIRNKEVEKIGFTVRFYSNTSKLPGNEANLSLEEWISKNFLPLQNGEIKETITFGKDNYTGILLKKYKGVGVIKLTPSVYTIRNGSIFEIISEVPTLETKDFPTGYNYDGIFDRMLSAFQFIERPVIVITLETNKKEYDYNEENGEFYLEEFYATIKNGGNFPIWYHCMASGVYPSFDLESYENGKWGEGSAVLFSNSVTFLGAFGRSPEEAKLNPQETITAHVMHTFIPGYKYRLVFYPRLKEICSSDDCLLDAVYSNEFIIKEKPELIEEIIGTPEFVDENILSEFNGLYVFKSNDGTTYYPILADGKSAENLNEFLNKEIIIKGYIENSIRPACLKFEENANGDYDCKEWVDQTVFIMDIKMAE